MEKKRQTAELLAWRTYKENEPINWARVEQMRKNYNRKERVNWARENVAYWAHDGASKHLITRAAKELLNLLGV